MPGSGLVFDVATLYLFGATVSVIASITVFLLRHLDEASRPALLLMSAALAAAALVLAALGVRSARPDAISAELALAGSPACLILALEATRRLYGRAPRTRLMLAALAAVPATVLAMPSPLAALATMLVVQLGMAAGIAWVASVDGDATDERAGRAYAMLAAALCAAFALRLAGLIVEEPSPVLAGGRASLSHLIAVVTYATTPVLMMVVVLLIVSERAIGRLRELATTDELTRLPTRRELVARAEAMLAPDPSGVDTAMLMIDIDHFKNINDRYGHDTGDRVLQHVAAVLRRTLRDDTVLARFGGEEFCALMPVRMPGQAQAVGERLRAAVEATPYTDGETRVALTISVGIAHHRIGQGFRELLREADRCVYEAKKEGRNRIIDDMALGATSLIVV